MTRISALALGSFLLLAAGVWAAGSEPVWQLETGGVSPEAAGLSVTAVKGVVPDECVASQERLCLRDDRFSVEVEWKDFANTTGAGQVLSFQSDDSGLFWFFEQDNWEMLVKVLAGCGFNDHFWVFSAATTNVEYTLRVTDHAAGLAKEYFNPLGNSAPAITDTEAFLSCQDALNLVVDRQAIPRTATGQAVALTAVVVSAEGQPLPGVAVSFAAERGQLENATVFTNTEGEARTQLIVTEVEVQDVPENGTFQVTASSESGGTTLNDSVEVTVLGAP